MEKLWAIIALVIKYGDYALEAGIEFAIVWPKLQKYLTLAYTFLTRNTPPTDAEKAHIDAAHEEIHNLLQQDFADREAEASAPGQS